MPVLGRHQTGRHPRGGRAAATLAGVLGYAVCGLEPAQRRPGATTDDPAPDNRGPGACAPGPEGGEPQMRPYEGMVIFDVGVEPPAIQAVIDRLLEAIRANDGVTGHVDRWGRRPFAYEVKHRREGYYVLVELTGEPRTVAEIDRLLALSDEVLRFKVIRIPDKVAARLASGVASHARPGPRGVPTRGQSGRGPRTEPARAVEGERARAGEDEPHGAAGRRTGPAPASEEGELTETGATAPAAG